MKARYHATGNYLEELPTLIKPICINGVSPNLCSSIRKNIGLKECECKIYQDHLASLRRIPCHPSCVGKWSDGQELTEGVEYEVKKHCIHADNCLLSSACITCDDTAFPLPVKSEENDLYWVELFQDILCNHIEVEAPLGKMKMDYGKAISELKSKYTLTKK